jgi:hypothetical protein
MVRILAVSDCSCGASRRLYCGLDNHQGFPEFCAKAKNGFVAGQNCFVAGSSDDIFPADVSNFSSLRRRSATAAVEAKRLVIAAA